MFKHNLLMQAMLFAGICGLRMADEKKDFSLEKPVDDMSTLDDIEDLPAFAIFPSGAYHIELKEGLVNKEINKHPAVEMEMTLIETLELTEQLSPDEKAPQPGDVCTVSFMKDNKIGAGKLKEVLLVLADKLGTKVVGELMKQSKGMHLVVVIFREYDKVKDRHYGKIKKIAVM